MKARRNPKAKLTLYICDCDNEFRLSEDQRYQFLGEIRQLFDGCTCGRGKDGLVLVEEV